MKCSFCGSDISRGTGKMFVGPTGVVHYWCSSKCEKNFMMGRSKKKVKWVIKAK